ncbi:retropepsin-like aspartic protease family protein [Nitrosococcus wardiae]|uniref:TIGR02281 family clan AA aspartic protease n=1 Tax=Nitrosococcus wardiae TaxID=1814290 RepID=A0A4V1AW62_9GAMM|nr:retropepsin-like aspartic protease [Nitrosococcus wardiae]QBQ55525.1 TIGR02281 family clan AA aspartic protease [Nitrosococcus wardiae]
MIGDIRIPLYLIVILVILSPAYGTAQEPSAKLKRTLNEELKRLSAVHGIVIKGLEKTRTIPARSTQGSLRQQLQKLLADFNYVMIQAPDKGIERVLILHPKEATPDVPEQIVLATERKGNHHVVRATVMGSRSMAIDVSLLVDTGASLVVLPASILPELGFNADDLEDQEVQTANGPVKAKVGQLHAIEIGTEVVYNVDTAFIDDSLLGRNGLLGMNVLGRYLMTIDDQQNLITLIK